MRRLRPEQYIDGVLKGERATLARAITLIESSLDADQALAARVLEGVLAHAGRSYWKASWRARGGRCGWESRACRALASPRSSKRWEPT